MTELTNLIQEHRKKLTQLDRVLEKKKEEEEALITSNNNLYTLSANSTTQDYSAEELERLKQALTLNLQVHANQLKMLINSK